MGEMNAAKVNGLPLINIKEPFFANSKNTLKRYNFLSSRNEF